jgi:hypothetical protein
MPWEKAHESLAIRAMEDSCETSTIEKTPHNITQIWKPKPKQTNNDRWTKTLKCLVVRGK